VPQETALRPADPLWPPRVRATWESYRQARTTADERIDAASRLPEAWRGEGEDDTAWWKAHGADHDVDVAYEEFTTVWGDWQIGHDTSPGPEDHEAGS
jgi:hypothetical protein